LEKASQVSIKKSQNSLIRTGRSNEKEEEKILA